MKIKIMTWIAFAITYVFLVSMVVLMSRIFYRISPVAPWISFMVTGLLICATTVGAVIGIMFFYAKRKK